jgi:hypothetical protein
MAPREKTPEKGQRKAKEKEESKRKKNSRQERRKGKEVATIRDEPEVNLFLGCLLSINQPPTGDTIQQTKRRSNRISQSKTLSPSTQAERSSRQSHSTLLKAEGQSTTWKRQKTHVADRAAE